MKKRVVFVADYFADDLTGGAELTTEALIESSPYDVVKIRSNQVTMDLLEQGHGLHWIFGNWAGLDKNLIPSIIANMSYSILEYDYKLCVYRSPEKHESETGKPCDCRDSAWGNIVGALYYGAKSLWWMSERQQQRYLASYPFLQDRQQTVLSSVFSESFWSRIKDLRESSSQSTRSGWLVLGSSSWIKGTEDAIEWCKANGKQYEVIQDLTPDQVLQKMSTAEGLVYLPRGGDTCPRIVIEAKLLGCQLNINENVEHGNELWFTSSDPEDTESYLYASRQTFWRGIEHAMNWKPSISGYTTTRNCIDQAYPYEDCIKSLLGFCDEVVVVDAGSTDGTLERLQEWAQSEPKLKLHTENLDWSSPRFAIFDGQLKAKARSLCTKEFCWQQDADEVLPESDWDKVVEICRRIPTEIKVLTLPVVEYWGSKDKVRIDVNPWKWRITRNDPDVTHGVPGHLRVHLEDGSYHSLPGTDGCDYIYKSNLQYVPHATFYPEEMHAARIAALKGDSEAFEHYEKWFKGVVEGLPTIRHYSWIDISRKIKTYRGYWQKHWESLYNIKQEDTAENNMFFDMPWSDVTDDMIEALAKRLGEETGGHVFHSKIDWTRPTPYLRLENE